MDHLNSKRKEHNTSVKEYASPGNKSLIHQSMIDPGYDQPKTALTPEQAVWQLEIVQSDL